jgi:hypothetical protein
MIHEYAVDPEALASFNEIWQALEQFGVAHGRVVVQCPKKWWSIVKRNLDAAESVLHPREYKSLEERCFRLKESRKLIYRKNLAFDGEKPFVEALAAEHADRPFRAVVQLQPSAQTSIPVLSRFDLHDGNPLWKVCRSQAVNKNPDALARVVVPLLRISADLLFIDPYFGSKPQDYQSFLRMIQMAAEQNCTLQRIEIHTGIKGTAAFIQDKARTSIMPRLPPETEIKVFQWKERHGGERLHDRFVLTDRGGMLSTYGWDSGDPGQTTEVSLLDEDSYRLRWTQYQRETAAFDLMGEPVVIKSYR